MAVPKVISDEDFQEARSRQKLLTDRARHDYDSGKLHPDLIKALDALRSAGYDMGVSTFYTGHSKMTTSGNVSRHGSGRAADAPTINGLSPGDKGYHETMLAAQKWAVANLGAATRESGNSLSFLYGFNDRSRGGNHMNHAHIGVGPNGWSGGRSLGREGTQSTRQGDGRPPSVISDADFQDPPQSVADFDFQEAGKTPPQSPQDARTARPGVSPTPNAPQQKEAAKLLSRYDVVNRKIETLQKEIADLGRPSLQKANALRKLMAERDALKSQFPTKSISATAGVTASGVGAMHNIAPTGKGGLLRPPTEEEIEAYKNETRQMNLRGQAGFVAETKGKSVADIVWDKVFPKASEPEKLAIQIGNFVGELTVGTANKLVSEGPGSAWKHIVEMTDPSQAIKQDPFAPGLALHERALIMLGMVGAAGGFADPSMNIKANEAHVLGSLTRGKKILTDYFARSGVKDAPKVVDSLVEPAVENLIRKEQVAASKPPVKPTVESTGPKVSTEPSIKTKAQEPGASPGGSTTHAFKAASDRIATKIAEMEATRKKSLGGNRQRGASNIGPEDFQLLALKAAKIAVDTAGNIELAIRSIAQEARLDKRQTALMRIRVHEIVAGEVGELPVQKLARMLRTAKESRKITDAARVAYRKEQAARVSGALDKGGVDAMYAALNELKGEQPLHKYESVFDAFSKDEVSAFMDAIRTRGDYAPQARAGLMRDFYDMMHGDTPTPYAIKHFERIFGPELTRALKSRWSFGKKMGVIFADIWNTPRAMMSSIDYSAPMRQAVIPTVSGLVSKRRAQTGAAFRDMVKAGYAEQYARVIHDSVVSDKNYSRLEDAGLYIADVFSENVHLLEREEAFMTSVAGKIPGIRGSERAFAAYLNKSRIDYANYLIDAAERFGELTHDQVVQIANVTNILHGRGGGMGNFGKGLSAANSIIWSPRLLLARLQTLTPATYTSLPRGARLAVAKDLVRFTLAGATTLYLAKQLGYEVETDLRSSDALKIKDGNTRYDIWGGFQQLARYTMQFITAEYKDKEGNVRATGGPMEKQKGDRTSTVLRFAESKLSPSASYLWGWLRGTNFIGEDFDPKSELAQRMWSLALQDMKDVLDEEIARDGYSTEAILSGFAKGLPAVFGVGTQTYGEKEGKTKKESSTPSYKYKPANTGGSSTYQPLNTEKKNKE